MVLLCLLLSSLVCHAQHSRRDTTIIIKGTPVKPATSATPQTASNSSATNNGATIKKNIANAVKPFDSSRIVKKKAPVPSKNASKSAQDPNALTYGAFKVSPDLYGEHAKVIMDYVQNYHKNFGPRLSRIKNGNKGYFSFIDNTMKKQGVPREMHSLCVIESALNPNAVSPVGATGPWQFMEPTAEMLGLRVDEELDERRDFYKSTHAAARYVKRLHNMFHDWLLVVAAYNCGPAPILRNLSKTGGRSFWDIKQYLPKETQNHVMAFIAVSVYYDRNSKVLDLGNLPKEGSKAKKGATPKEKTAPIVKGKTNSKPSTKPSTVTPADDDDLDIADEPVANAFDPNAPQFTPDELQSVLTLKVKGAYNLETIAEVLDVDIKKLRRWNPNFNEQAYANNGPVSLTIPAKSIDAFLVKKQEILSKCLKNPHPTSGQTINLDPRQVAKLPNYANVSNQQGAENSTHTNKTAAQNSSTKTETTAAKKPATKVETPAVADKKEEAKPAKPTAAKQKNKTYTVKNGDNLTEIAEQFGLTVARIMELNKMKKPVIHPGHTLYLE
jgi:membrane-bound lytic murein transglycosylase D